MTEKQLGDMTNEELQGEARALRSASINHAFMIGFLVGIILFGVGSLLIGLLRGLSIGYGALALLMLIPLYLIRGLGNDPEIKQAKAVKAEIRRRGLRR
ncbi:hypothetical protein [Brevundimonas sp.]|uniref:hypothetical protein n=1 Tax=Brevundimonas sp. TaxID=1871086 RepID=UPI0026253AD7|nr:hypothetical protein [Brevundimonas sp.]